MARATSRLTRRHVYPVAIDEQARWEVAVPVVRLVESGWLALKLERMKGRGG